MFLICFNFQRASMLLKVSASRSLKAGENVVWVLNSLDLGEMPTRHLIRIQAVCIWHYSCE